MKHDCVQSPGKTKSSIRRPRKTANIGHYMFIIRNMIRKQTIFQCFSKKENILAELWDFRKAKLSSTKQDKK